MAASSNLLSGLETFHFAFRKQMKRNADAVVLFVHWYLVKNGFVCIVDGKKTEVLPDDWNSDEELYLINYSLDSKGYELKVLAVDHSLIINLLRKSTERTASVNCLVTDFVSKFENEFQCLFVNAHDLYDDITKEFEPLIKEAKSKAEGTSGSVQDKKDKKPDSVKSDEDPLRVTSDRTRLVDPTFPLGAYGRSDLDPLRFDPSGGMIFDPFRHNNPSLMPDSRLPRDSVPPRARFDPFGPPMPDDLRSGRPNRNRPDPSGFNPPSFNRPGFDDNMFM